MVNKKCNDKNQIISIKYPNNAPVLSNSIPLLPTAALLAVLMTMVPLVPTGEDAKPDVMVTCGWVGKGVGWKEGGKSVNSLFAITTKRSLCSFSTVVFLLFLVVCQSDCLFVYLAACGPCAIGSRPCGHHDVAARATVGGWVGWGVGGWA
jgi:hypothetical protein